MSMPEEVNRILTDRISDLLFCPTPSAVGNLQQEGFQAFEASVFQVGDVMEDAVIFYRNKASEVSKVLKHNKLETDKYLLATVHRAENTDDKGRLSEIVAALNRLHDTCQVLVPMHPRTKAKIKEQGLEVKFTTIEPVGYFDMLQLIQNSALVLTDSGGLQKEAYINNKFCVTLRDETEWVELVNEGYNVLAGASQSKIIEATRDGLEKEFVKKSELYGGGKASRRIIEFVMEDYVRRYQKPQEA